MSRMDDDAAQRFASSLAHFTPGSSRRPTRGTRHEIDAIRAELVAAGSTEAFGRALTQALAAYLNRPVRVSADVRTSGARPGDIVIYAAEIGAIRWWVEFDARLVWSIADAMLGGSGAAERPKDAKRCEELATKVAAIFLTEITAVASIAPPMSVRLVDEASQDHNGPPHVSDGDAQIIGTCAVGTDAFAWRAGVATTSSAPMTEIKTEMPPAPPSTEAPPESDQRTASERVGAALIAACSSLQGALRCSVSSGQPTVRELEDAQMPPAALRLALTAGGPGALVLSAPSETVVAFAAGVAGVPAPATTGSGSIALAAAEAALRQLIREVADRLPRLTGVPQRIVHLASDAQLARARCVAANIELKVAGSDADLNFIVPAWMTEVI